MFLSFFLVNWSRNFNKIIQIRYTGSEKSISYRRYVRSLDGYRFDPKYIMKSIRFRIKSILTWGAIKGGGNKIIIRCPKRLDSNTYLTVLEEGLQDMHANDSVFMQNGTPWLTLRSIMSYLEKKKICLLSEWPLQSPDINVIKKM